MLAEVAQQSNFTQCLFRNDLVHTHGRNSFDGDLASGAHVLCRAAGEAIAQQSEGASNTRNPKPQTLAHASKKERKKERKKETHQTTP